MFVFQNSSHFMSGEVYHYLLRLWKGTSDVKSVYRHPVVSQRMHCICIRGTTVGTGYFNLV